MGLICAGWHGWNADLPQAALAASNLSAWTGLNAKIQFQANNPLALNKKGGGEGENKKSKKKNKEKGKKKKEETQESD